MTKKGQDEVQELAPLGDSGQALPPRGKRERAPPPRGNRERHRRLGSSVRKNQRAPPLQEGLKQAPLPRSKHQWASPFRELCERLPPPWIGHKQTKPLTTNISGRSCTLVISPGWPRNRHKALGALRPITATSRGM